MFFLFYVKEDNLLKRVSGEEGDRTLSNKQKKKRKVAPFKA